LSKKLRLKKFKGEKLEVLTRERPYVVQMIQTQILYDIAGMLEDLGKTLIDFHQDYQQTIPKGMLLPIELTITDKLTVIDRNTPRMNIPWMTFDIFNDGPDPVYIAVNKNYIEWIAPISIDESLTVNMRKTQVEKVLLQCKKGKKANVRIYALW